MTGQGQERVVNAGRVPRTATRRDAILRLLDGRRTAREIADQVGVSDRNVRAVLSKLGMAGHLRPACGAPVPARLPACVVMRDLALPAEIAGWLLDQTKNGSLVQDVIRGAIIDAYQEETGL